MNLITEENKNQEVLSNSEKSNSLLIHLSALASLVVPFGSIILPLILWQSMKNDSKFVDHHGKEAVNFNLSFFLYNIIIVLVLIGTVLGTVFSGIAAEQSSGNPEDVMAILFSTGGFIIALILIVLLSIGKLIMLIIAGIRANDGEWYKYPMTIHFIR